MKLTQSVRLLVRATGLEGAGHWPAGAKKLDNWKAKCKVEKLIWLGIVLGYLHN